MNDYPVTLNLYNNIQVFFRPVEEKDFNHLSILIHDIPRSELIIYKDDVVTGEKIEEWFLSQKYQKNVHILAVAGKRVVAEGTMHSEGLYWNNAAEIKLIVHPEFRNMGIGRKMFSILLQEGFRNKIQKIVVRYTPENKGFQKILEQFEFKPEAVLHYYIQDEETKKRKDLVVASFDLGSWSKRFEYYRNLFNL